MASFLDLWGPAPRPREGMLTSFARSVTPRAAGVFLLFAALAAVLASSQLQSAHAAAPSPPKRIGGIVLPRGQVGPGVLGNGDLSWHGGPVMSTNKPYAIFWIPPGQTVSANYVSTINQYFQDVAHDSGLSTNVYATDTQYSGITYSSAFDPATQSYTDTAAFPANGCSPYGGAPASVCLTDAQLQAEIGKVIALKGWTKSGTNMFFIFTPKNVESYDGSGGYTFKQYCAYHGVTSSGAIYANMPYSVTSISLYVGACTTGQYPNGDDADATLNVTSHEHNEAITDFQLNAWYDAARYENGDKCAWDFGAVTGPNGGQYNQTINGHHYYLQREYSNDGHACLQTYTVPPPPGPPTVSSFAPASGPVGTTVDVTGTNFSGVTSVTFNDTASTNYTVLSSTDLHADVPVNATDGPIAVATSQGTGTSSSSFTVTIPGSGPPTIDVFSPTSGTVGTNVAITGTNLSTATLVTFNGTASTSVTLNSDTLIHAVVPANATTGPVAVTNPQDTATTANSFTVVVVVPKPSISSFTPTSGKRGIKVKILGNNFSSASAVKLGGFTAAFTVDSNAQITATVPNGVRVGGQYRWAVTTPGGTASSTTYFRVTG
jgi:hypothetical protein